MLTAGNEDDEDLDQVEPTPLNIDNGKEPNENVEPEPIDDSTQIADSNTTTQEGTTSQQEEATKSSNVENTENILTFVCDLCNKETGTHDEHRVHMANIHDLIEYWCFRCNQLQPDANSLNSHVLANHVKKTFPCELCFKKFDTYQSRKKHMKVHGDKKYLCGQCGKCFLSPVHLHQHEARHDKVKTIKCNLCDSWFFKKWEVQRHIQYIHTLGYSERCEKCGRGYKSKENLKHHFNEKHTKRKYTCPECGKRIKSRMTFLNHVKRIHNLPRKLPPKMLEPTSDTESDVGQ